MSSPGAAQGHHAHPHHHHDSSRNIAAAFVLNFSFTLLELAGGVLSGSLAILANAVHDLGDSVSLGLAWWLEKHSKKGRDLDFSYGYQRFSLLSVLISGGVILSGSVLILFESLPRLFQASAPVEGKTMLLFAGLGVAMNLFTAWRLHRGHTHNERMLSWHQVSDAVGWLTVLVGSFFVWLKGWTWVDGLLAVTLSLWVIVSVCRQLWGTLQVLLQRRPELFATHDFLAQVQTFSGVISVHDLHVWSLDGLRHILSLHLVLKPEAPAAAIKSQIKELLRGYGDFHVTIETEIQGEECDENCDTPRPHRH